MGMKRIITSTVLAIILFTFLSCERVMILDANEKPVVVVDCMISNEPVQILKLSFSKGASKDTYEKVKDAEAKLIECGENQSKEYLFRKEADGVWILDHAAQEGQTYRLEINVPGYEQISSEPQTIIPLTVAAQREDCREHSLIQEHYHKYDYSPIYYSANRADEAFHLFICAKYYDAQSCEKKIEDYICVDQPTDDSYITNLEYDLKIYPTLIGHFLHNKYLSILVPAIIPETKVFLFHIGGPFRGEYHYSFDPNDEHLIYNYGVMENPGQTEGYIEFSRLNKETENFYFTILKDYLDIKESSDISSIYLRNNIYTNIKGAVGYFGCKTVKKLMWSSDPMGEDPIYYDPKDPV